MKTYYRYLSVLLFAITLLMGLTAQAQGIRVNYTGSRPTINDFVTAYLAQGGDDELISSIRKDWKSQQQGRALSNGASFTIDVRNGFVRYDKRYTATSYNYTEFCYWNCKDGKHKLLAINNGCIEEGRPVTSQLSGLSFFTYNNQTKSMQPTSCLDLGASIDVRPVVTYALPQAGKDIMATIHAQQGEVQILMKWNGAKFDQEQLGRPAGNVQVSEPMGSFGETIKYKNDDYIRVYTAEQFLNALGSNRNVLVAKNTEINLTPMLNNQSLFRTRFKMWTSDVSQGISGGRETVVSEQVFDGRQLTLVNMKQLVIEGEQNSRIVVEPRYAFCLNFVDCDQCTVSNLTIGHTEDGYCQGGVIGMKRGWRNTIVDCDLYGCGTYGLDLEGTKSFSLYSSNIHDCTYGIMQLHNCEAVHSTHCDFFNNREFTLVEGYGSVGTVFEDCRFYSNWGDGPLFSFANDFILLGCDIHHPTEKLGTMDKCQQPSQSQPNKFSPNSSDNSIRGREIGPDKSRR
ncbi:MAG: right-handed parallel beta-helix repeat-containing protein [Prevotella sp.]|nr:right-handed parallel beta-helix repeat-containing protein [Prevotella sp.]